MKTQQDQENVLPVVQQKVNKQESTFKDERSETVMQGKLYDMVNNSQQVTQLQSLQSMADNRVQNSPFAPIQRKENNTGLPDNLKTGMENLSGISLDDVKVHRNSDKPAQLQAHAYAQGTDIHLAAGQEKHLPHEAWHVVQQKQGRVKPTMQMKGKVNVNDDSGLEKEADVMGAKALKLEKTDNIQLKTIESSNEVYQLEDMKTKMQEAGSGTETSVGWDSWSSGDKSIEEGASKAVDTANPLEHPLYELYLKRVEVLNGKFKNKPLKPMMAKMVFMNFIDTVHKNLGKNLPKQKQKDGSEHAYLIDYGSSVFRGIMDSTNLMITELKKFSNIQFEKANSFGFWSKDEGKEMAETEAELTLETSAIGGLFDGMGSMLGQKMFDFPIWAALSRAFAEKVAEQMRSGTKTIDVYAGGQLTSNDANVYQVVEQVALKKGIEGLGKTMEDCVTYHAVARKYKNDATIDMSVNGNGIWISGRNREAVLKEGNKQFNKLSSKP